MKTPSLITESPEGTIGKKPKKSDPYWVEYQLEVLQDRQNELRAFYGTISSCASVVSVHHFNFEPWWKKGPVVRVLAPTAAHRVLNSVCRRNRPWDSKEDEVLYGERWEATRDLFQAQSMLALQEHHPTSQGGVWYLGKEVHCFLNSQGLDVGDEIRFAILFLRGRVRTWLDEKKNKLLFGWFDRVSA